MEENNDKKAIQELKQFIEQINKPKENEIFEKEIVFKETLKKIEKQKKKKLLIIRSFLNCKVLSCLLY